MIATFEVLVFKFRWLWGCKWLCAPIHLFACVQLSLPAWLMLQSFPPVFGPVLGSNRLYWWRWGDLLLELSTHSKKICTHWFSESNWCVCYDSLSKFHNIEMNQRRTEAQQVADSADHIPPRSTVKTEPSLLQPLLKHRSHGEYHQQKRSVWLLSLFNTQLQCSKNMHYATRNEYILGLQQLLCWAIINHSECDQTL